MPFRMPCETFSLHPTARDASSPAEHLGFLLHRTDGNPAESLTEHLPFPSLYRSSSTL